MPGTAFVLPEHQTESVVENRSCVGRLYAMATRVALPARATATCALQLAETAWPGGRPCGIRNRTLSHIPTREGWRDDPVDLAFMGGRQTMSNAVNQLNAGAAILALIDRKRAETGYESLGANIERAVIELQLQELEREILENPGAFGPWLVRRRGAD